MKILLDEMYAGHREHLAYLCWHITFIKYAGLKGADDAELVKYAKKNNMVIVTADCKVEEFAKLFGVECVIINKVDLVRLIDEKLKAL
jgi:predicted nuclease of predicted toxin-antitoxin system